MRVTQSPTDTWAAQQLREAAAHGQSPNSLIRDGDNKFGPRWVQPQLMVENLISLCKPISGSFFIRVLSR